MKRLSTVIVFVIGAQSFAWGYQNPTSWRLSTDDTTMVVAVQQGMPAVTELRSTKSDSNWLLAPAPEVLPSSVTQQDAAVATKWQYEGGALDPAEWPTGVALLQPSSRSGTAVDLAGPPGTWPDGALVDDRQSFWCGHYDRPSGQSRAQQHWQFPRMSRWTPGGSSGARETPPRKAVRSFKV